MSISQFKATLSDVIYTGVLSPTLYVENFITKQNDVIIFVVLNSIILFTTCTIYIIDIVLLLSNDPLFQFTDSSSLPLPLLKLNPFIRFNHAWASFEVNSKFNSTYSIDHGLLMLFYHITTLFLFNISYNFVVFATNFGCIFYLFFCFGPSNHPFHLKMRCIGWKKVRISYLIWRTKSNCIGLAYRIYQILPLSHRNSQIGHLGLAQILMHNW